MDIGIYSFVLFLSDKKQYLLYVPDFVFRILSENETGHGILIS